MSLKKYYVNQLIMSGRDFLNLKQIIQMSEIKPIQAIIPKVTSEITLSKPLKTATKLIQTYGLKIAEIQNPIPSFDTEVGKKYFTRYLELLSDNYHKDFINPSGSLYRNAKLIYDLAVQDGFSHLEFSALVRKFIKHNPYSYFSSAKFFELERWKLYPESWLQKEKEKDINCIKLMECFIYTDARGIETKLYRYYDETNPIIKHKDFKILKGWDVGGHYSESIDNDSIKANDNDLKQEIERLQRIIVDLNLYIKNLLTQIDNLKNEK